MICIGPGYGTTFFRRCTYGLEVFLSKGCSACRLAIGMGRASLLGVHGTSCNQSRAEKGQPFQTLAKVLLSL